MARQLHPRASARSGLRDGSSLIELLFAALLLMVALLAAAPLFVRAIRDVRTGASRSTASVMAQSRVEAWRPPPEGAEPARVAELEYYSSEAREWLGAPPPPPDRVLWVRRTSSRPYPLKAIADGRLDREESAPGDRGRPEVALIALRVEVARRVGGPSTAVLERLEWAVR